MSTWDAAARDAGAIEAVLAAALPEYVAFSVMSGEPTRQLSDAEAALLHPRATPRRRTHLLLGRAAAHAALDQLGRPADSLLRGPHREPLWPTDVVGSISHASEIAVAIAALGDDCGGLGVDLEHVGRWFLELDEHVAHDEELDAVETLDPGERAEAIVGLFAAKEAIYKAFFPRVGRFFGFRAARVAMGADGGVTGRLVDDLDPAYPPDRTFPIRLSRVGDLVLAVVVLDAD